MTPDRVANAVQVPYGTYASLVKSGGLPELVPFNDWAAGTTSAAGWSLLKQDGPTKASINDGWTFFGYPYAPQAGGC